MRKIRLFFRYSSQFSWRENRGDEVEEEEEVEVPESFRVKMVGVVGGRRREARVRVDKDSGIFTSCGSAEGSSGEEGQERLDRSLRSDGEKNKETEKRGRSEEIKNHFEESQRVQKSRERLDIMEDSEERQAIMWEGDEGCAKMDMRDVLLETRPDNKILVVKDGKQVFREPSTVKFKEVVGRKSRGDSRKETTVEENREPCTCLHHPPPSNVSSASYQRRSRVASERRGVSLERGLEERRRRRMEEERRREKELVRAQEREARRKEERRLRAGGGDPRGVQGDPRRREQTRSVSKGRAELPQYQSREGREGSYLSFTGFEGGCWDSRQLEQVSFCDSLSF